MDLQLDRKNKYIISKIIDKYIDLAGRAGFEPAYADSKDPCLTAWRPASK